MDYEKMLKELADKLMEVVETQGFLIKAVEDVAAAVAGGGLADLDNVFAPLARKPDAPTVPTRGEPNTFALLASLWSLTEGQVKTYGNTTFKMLVKPDMAVAGGTGLMRIFNAEIKGGSEDIGIRADWAKMARRHTFLAEFMKAESSDGVRWVREYNKEGGGWRHAAFVQYVTWDNSYTGLRQETQISQDGKAYVVRCDDTKLNGRSGA